MARWCAAKRRYGWRGRARVALLLAVLLASAFPAASSAQGAATITVTSTANGGGTCPHESQCTLRDALVAVADGGTILFAVTEQIELNSTLTVAKDVTIRGPGAAILAVSGRNVVPVFRVDSFADATISGLTIEKGFSEGIVGGAGVRVDFLGRLRITDSVIQGNHSTVSDGGGLSNGGTLTVENSSVNNNSSPNGGGIFSSNTLTVTNSTLTDNSANLGLGRGGGISAGTSATVTNSTLSGNSAIDGGGIYAFSGVSLRNSIVVNSTSGGNCAGSISSNGNNLSDTTACFANNPSIGDVVTTVPVLAPLATHPPAMTRAFPLLPNSPAIDGVIHNPANCPATDQRGVSRPQAIYGPRCDIGAYERAGTVPQISAIGPQSTAEDTSTGAIPFTVGDDETTPGALVVTATTSNQGIVPNANVVIGGSGANRIVTLTPLPHQNGPVDVTLTVSDGTFSSSRTFTLTVTAVNDQPITTAPGTQSVDEDASLIFSAANGNQITVADLDAGAASVQVTLAATNGTVRLNGTTNLGVTAGADGTSAVTVVGPLTSLNNALNGLRFTPTPGYAGPAALQVTSSDLGNTGAPGPLTDTDTVAITVNAVNDVPVATNDSYSIGATQTLTVSPAQGVLANDSDIETPAASLTAAIVTNPANGMLTLSPNGGFTYVPAASFAGTDSFTYRASDGTATSSPATVTIAVTGSHCAPRATVKVSTAVIGGKLQTTVEALPLNGQTNNRLISLVFGAFKNGTVTINSQSIASGATYTPPDNTTKVTLVVERGAQGASQPTTIPFDAEDVCGTWPSLVGGGTGAGF